MTAETGGVKFVDAGDRTVGAEHGLGVRASARPRSCLAGQSKSGTCFYVLDDEAARHDHVRESGRVRAAARRTGHRSRPTRAWQATW